MADELDSSEDYSDFSDDDPNHKYPRELLQGLSDLQEQKQLCDVTIVVGGRAFHAHKAVLAACSKYFFAMFTSGFKERNESEIKIEGSAEIFALLLKFAYTGRLYVGDESLDTVYGILEMACYMQFTRCADICSRYIEDAFRSEEVEISVSLACKLSILARNHCNLRRVVHASERYLESKVEELTDTDVFLQQASVSFLQELLCREVLASEVKVLEMVVTWLKHDWDNRCVHSHQLLQKIRLGLIPPEDLKELVGPEILEIPECLNLVNRVLELQVSEKSKRTLSLENPEIFATRSTITAPILTYFEDYKHQISKFQYYSKGTHEWRALDGIATLYPAFNQAMIVAGGTLYAAGGCLASNYLKKFYRYEAEDNKWHSLPPMKTARSSFSMVHLDGFIYAIGGLGNNKATLNLVERYDIVKKKWDNVASLPIDCRPISVVVFKGVVLVYCMIAVPQKEESFKHVLLVYCPSKGDWQTIVLIDESMRRNPVLFVFKNQCYRILYGSSKHSVSGREHPSVKALDIQTQDDGIISLKFGDEIPQDCMPRLHRGGAFHIGGEVFVDALGFVCSTGVTISPDQTDKVDLDEWEDFGEYAEPGMTMFTFDRKQLTSNK